MCRSKGSKINQESTNLTPLKYTTCCISEGNTSGRGQSKLSSTGMMLQSLSRAVTISWSYMKMKYFHKDWCPNYFIWTMTKTIINFTTCFFLYQCLSFFNIKIFISFHFLYSPYNSFEFCPGKILKVVWSNFKPCHKSKTQTT